MSGEDHVTRVHRALSAPRRAEILRLLQQADGPMAVQDVVDATGLHPNTVRNHLERLGKAGLVSQFTEDRTTPGRVSQFTEDRTTPGRPRTLYRATDPTPDEGRGDAGGYRALAVLLADGLAETDDPGGAAMAAGERWIEAVADRDWPARPATTDVATATLVELLDDLGFEPQTDLDHDAILLRQCPFAEVARDHRTVVCGIHLGMVHRTLDRLDSPLRATELEPFVHDDPLLCRIHLTTDLPEAQAERTPLPVLVTKTTPATRRRNA
jgi:predicted ArsR family transcriptional regulator